MSVLEETARLAISVDGDDYEILAGVDGGLNVLATILHLAATDIFTLHGLNLQFANLRLDLTPSDGLHLVNAHV